ncbi:MAG TPA: hypothetical protein VJ746_04360 [Nitrospira sp.]|nr:hypothetical protein [Nitrospira sp.]
MTSREAGVRLRLACLAGVVVAAAGCHMTSGLVSSPRTPVEQLLLTQSLFRGLDDAALPLKPGDSIAVETAWPPTHQDFAGDKTYAEAVLVSWMVKKGAIIGRERPLYRFRVLLHAFGLERQESFVGIPFLVTLYRKIHDRSYARLSFDIIDESSGRLVSSPSPVEASVYFKRYILFFLFSWTSTDLIPPPL